MSTELLHINDIMVATFFQSKIVAIALALKIY